MIGIEKQKEVFNMSKEDNIINDKELETVRIFYNNEIQNYD